MAHPHPTSPPYQQPTSEAYSSERSHPSVHQPPLPFSYGYPPPEVYGYRSALPYGYTNPGPLAHVYSAPSQHIYMPYFHAAAAPWPLAPEPPREMHATERTTMTNSVGRIERTNFAVVDEAHDQEHIANENFEGEDKSHHGVIFLGGAEELRRLPQGADFSVTDKSHNIKRVLRGKGTVSTHHGMVFDFTSGLK